MLRDCSVSSIPCPPSKYQRVKSSKSLTRSAFVSGASRIGDALAIIDQRAAYASNRFDATSDSTSALVLSRSEFAK